MLPTKYIRSRLTIRPEMIREILSVAKDELLDTSSRHASRMSSLRRTNRKVRFLENRYGSATKIPAALPSSEAAAAPATPMRRNFMNTTSRMMFTPLAAITEPIASLERLSTMANPDRIRFTPTNGVESSVKNVYRATSSVIAPLLDKMPLK